MYPLELNRMITETSEAFHIFALAFRKIISRNFRRCQLRKLSLLLIPGLLLVACSKRQTPNPSQSTPSAEAAAPITGPFSPAELQKFNSLDPIDSHVHIYQTNPAFLALLQRLNLHVLNIVVPHTPDPRALEQERRQSWDFVHASHGQAALCTTFNPFVYREPGFSSAAIAQINRDFAQGAVAVKIWKNIGEQVKDAKGNYILPDNPVFEPIYKDIAAHNKTLIAHVADPDTIWQPPTPAAPDYSYYIEHPEWYMYNRPNAPSKQAILNARDHLLEQNPNLRVVGAHLGSMEADLHQLGRRLDEYPNFAVDLAARMPYLVLHPRADMIAFIEKYQDRLLYATDNDFLADAGVAGSLRSWENVYAFDWRFLSTSDTLKYKDRSIQGLNLPPQILRKLYHDNAVRWIPGILAKQ
jgi:predicted TIM-barrel fold metal-dependent hydrolase